MQQNARGPFYILEVEYVGPNPDEPNHIHGHRFSILTKQPVTNMSHEPLDKPGWLGTTGDWCETYHGEFGTVDAAVARIHEIHPDAIEIDVDDDDQPEDHSCIKAFRAVPEDDVCDAADWLYPAKQDIITDHGITANTSDDVLGEIAAELAKEAKTEGYYLTGSILDWLEETREELRETL